MKTLPIQLLLLFSLLLVIYSCEKEDSIIEQENRLKTVALEDAQAFLSQSWKKNSSGSGNSFITSISEEINYEDITNTDEELAVIPVTTTYKHLQSRIALLEIDGEVQSVVVSLKPFEHSTPGNFSGELLITDIKGNFIKAFKVENNILVIEYIIKNKIYKNYYEDLDKNSSYNSNAKSCEDFAGTEWCIDGEEVIVTAYLPTPYVSLSHMYPTGGGGEESNCEVGCDNNWNPSGGGGGDANLNPEPEPESENCPEGFYQNLEGECIEILPCNTNDEILDSAALQAAFADIWEQSGALNTDIPMESRLEEGGWIVENSGRFGFIPFDSSWSRTPCGINPPANWASTIPDNIVGYVHTHPFYLGEDRRSICQQAEAEYQGGPSDDDYFLLMAIASEVGNFNILGFVIDGEQITSFDFTRTENMQNFNRCGY
ncbi:hypothetical protein G3567_09875 [Psychroflexus sp. YR1-1]|uniref:DUF4329 domain-containing protein n=1 Tax=Psychroflexus aurantiacus TaxID=2709310 RepID=A0A6B3R1G5_9FLAO|nr:hypothetical protein [Psychroflexus aurantiacus]NEV94449.1 hypothetical protein [Psychroflexus aurantiacus]